MEFLAKLNDVLQKIDPAKAQPIIDALKRPEFLAIVQQLGLPNPELAVSVLSFLLSVEQAIQPIVAEIIKALEAK